MAEAPNRRASAALILGALAGALATATVLSTAYPLTRRLYATEQSLVGRHVSTAAVLTQQRVERGEPVDESTPARLQVEYLRVTGASRTPQEFGRGPVDGVIEQACATGIESFQDGDDVWVASCASSNDTQVIAAYRPPRRPTTELLVTFIWAAGLVGIVTAMGVVAMLRPLTNLSRALDRVRSGERGVRVGYTGLSELDDLVDRLNMAAKAMEEREDAIIGRIEAVQQLARLVAHEVRNPLQSLELLTDLIASESNPHERDELARSLHDEISTLNAVVERLLSREATSGALRLALVKQPMRDTIEHIIKLRQPEASTFGCRIEAGEITDTAVPYDAALFGRSIENLVINAMQVVPRGYGLIRISAFDDGDYVAVAVEDNGSGVDPDFGAQIFEPNVTTKEYGTGLGLTLVRGVVDAHGGDIAYDDSAIGGARFIARLPTNEVRPEP